MVHATSSLSFFLLRCLPPPPSPSPPLLLLLLPLHPVRLYKWRGYLFGSAPPSLSLSFWSFSSSSPPGGVQRRRKEERERSPKNKAGDSLLRWEKENIMQWGKATFRVGDALLPLRSFISLSLFLSLPFCLNWDEPYHINHSLPLPSSTFFFHRVFPPPPPPPKNRTFWNCLVIV